MAFREYKRTEILDFIRLQTLVNKDDVLAVVNAYEDAIEAILLNNGKYRFGNIGIFFNREKKDAPPRLGRNLYSGEELYYERKRHNIPAFKFNKPIKNKMKEKTLENTFIEQSKKSGNNNG